MGRNFVKWPMAALINFQRRAEENLLLKPDGQLLYLLLHEPLGVVEELPEAAEVVHYVALPPRVAQA